VEKRLIPKFESEAQEAAWWFDHREETARDLIAAVKEGRLAPTLKVRYAERMRKLAEQAVDTKQEVSAKSSRAA
jgi:hypothetical protein